MWRKARPLAAPKVNSDDDGTPRLELTPGTRIQAKLETQISSAVQAPVVAVVEYTYAIGDRIIVPAGARVYGQLQQADRSGLVSVKFDEIELLDGAREKIDAIGTGLDLGPIKGNVYGKNTGKNFLVRAASGIGSVLAEVAGNNSSAAFSEDDMLRERLAENIGTAGDSEVMSLNANSRVVVSVPADTKIYVVFTKHEQTPCRTSQGSRHGPVDCPPPHDFLFFALASVPGLSCVWPSYSTGELPCGSSVACVAHLRNAPVMRPSLGCALHVRVKVGPHDPVRSWAIFAPDAPMCSWAKIGPVDPMCD